MKCQGAVLRGVGEDWEVKEITLDPPREGEVLVKMAVAGVCHSDDHYATGDMHPVPDSAAIIEATGGTVPEYFPMLGGHEGAGVVEEVGPGVRSVQPGDRVAFSFIPACGTCRWCVSGMTYLCDDGAMMFAKEMIDRRHRATPPRRRGSDGDDATRHVRRIHRPRRGVVIKIDDSIPFEAASLVSCGVTTGWGSEPSASERNPATPSSIVGTGGVGINAVQGARAAGANAVSPWIPLSSSGIRPSSSARRTPARPSRRPSRWCRSSRGVMADRVVLTPSVLHAELLAPAMMLTRKGGTCLMTAVPKLDINIGAADTRRLHPVLQDPQGPDVRRDEPPREHADAVVDVPQRQPQARRAGHGRYRLDQINDAITDMREGRNIRGIIEFD